MLSNWKKVSARLDFQKCVQWIFYGVGSYFVAVAEYRFIINFKSPGQLIVADRPAFGKPRSKIHFIVKFNKAFAKAVTHYNPAEEIIGRFKAVCKVGNAKFYRIFSRTAFAESSPPQPAAAKASNPIMQALP